MRACAHTHSRGGRSGRHAAKAATSERLATLSTLERHAATRRKPSATDAATTAAVRCTVYLRPPTIPARALPCVLRQHSAILQSWNVSTRQSVGLQKSIPPWDKFYVNMFSCISVLIMNIRLLGGYLFKHNQEPNPNTNEVPQNDSRVIAFSRKLAYLSLCLLLSPK